MRLSFTSFRGTLFLFLLKVCFTNLAYSAEPLLGSYMENGNFKESFKLDVKTLKSNQTFSRQQFPIQMWDKYFSPLGQKKIISKKADRGFNTRIDKKISKMSKINIEESSWNNHIAKIRKDAGINLDKKAHMISGQDAYQMLLQDRRQFEAMADKMDLQSLNRYQFRSNRPQGEIPVDTISENISN